MARSLRRIRWSRGKKKSSKAALDSSEFRFQSLHRALDELFRVVELLEHERDVHLRFSRKPIAPAVDAVLADEGQRIGEEIERDGEPSARGAHHRLVCFQRVAMLVENRHVSPCAVWRAAARRGWAGCADCGAAG